MVLTSRLPSFAILFSLKNLGCVPGLVTWLIDHPRQKRLQAPQEHINLHVRNIYSLC